MQINLASLNTTRKKIVVLSGAGISAESGISTFRDSNGLWEKYDIHEVATIDAWHKNPTLVLDFYNARRRQVLAAMPNPAHYALVELETKYDVTIITQNIDDLHERSGSSNILHLHGEILKARSVRHEQILYPISGDLKLGDRNEVGDQLRPHIVWFGEAVPAMETAEQIVRSCDILIVIGTSLNVYPAAGLIFACSPHARKIVVDPEMINLDEHGFIQHVGTAANKVPVLVKSLLG